MTSLFRKLAVLALLPLSLQAGTYVLLPPDLDSRGWYDNTGAHPPALGNYIVGQPSANSFRNFFIFDLGGLPTSETVTSATLTLYNPSIATGSSMDGYQSADPTETFQLFSVDSTSLTALKAGGTGLTGIFADLGDGTAYNDGLVVSAASNGAHLAITLNASFLAYAQSNWGGQIALGGALTTLSGSPGEALFIATHVPLNYTTLTLTTTLAIPEPSVAAVAAGLAALGLVARRRRRAFTN